MLKDCSAISLRTCRASSTESLPFGAASDVASTSATGAST